MNGFISAKLVSMTHIDIMVFSNTLFDNNQTFQLFIDGERKYSPTIVRRTTNKDLYIFRLELREPFDFSKRYFVSYYNFPLQLVDVSSAVTFKEFDSMFNYEGDDLGSIYSIKETSFALWAPLSPSVQLKIENENKEFEIHQMVRGDKGVFRLTLKGDYKNRLYSYLVENNGIVRESTDIYGKGSSLNSQYSAVIDFNEVNKMGKVDCKNSHLKATESIIYEVHVRDFTEDMNTDIVNKGKYLGFVEKGRKTKGGHPAGLDYLKYLGITHVQLQPIHDVNNVDELNPKASYNWGYDPCSYFAIEGAYSTNPMDPVTRIKEFKEMINALHKENIGVVIDVVYNHCYEWLYTAFEKCVPGYYFRVKKDGILSSCSGCGNDFASEKMMVRKLIVDSVKYLFETFDIDGLRFDLMGLLDIQTMKDIEKAVRDIKKDALLYGEGWNMGMQIPEENRASSDNADQLPGYGFFNDMYRDIVKGPTFFDHITEKGFANGDINYYFGLEYVMHGSVLDLSYRHRYLNAGQSINYVECHDNNTLFDKFVKSNPDEDNDALYERVRMANAIVLLSFGVPFFHMGQEIGQSKMGLDNTYNIPRINNMKWDLVDDNFQMVERFRFFAHIRKDVFKFLHATDSKDIKGKFQFVKLEEQPLVGIRIYDEEVTQKYRDAIIVINVTNDIITHVSEEYRALLLSTEEDNPIMNRIVVPARSINILYKI